MVRKGGFEPPRLSAPPPQDGVSASSTTSAKINDLQALSNIYTLAGRRTSSRAQLFQPHVRRKSQVSIHGQGKGCLVPNASRNSRHGDRVGARGRSARTGIWAPTAATK